MELCITSPYAQLQQRGREAEHVTRGMKSEGRKEQKKDRVSSVTSLSTASRLSEQMFSLRLVV